MEAGQALEAALLIFNITDDESVSYILALLLLFGVCFRVSSSSLDMTDMFSVLRQALIKYPLDAIFINIRHFQHH